ncbi:hypothetical protein [Brevundimonas vesicularis]|uniref:hypothetical protein n=1 Tax=Brevundimonas vesicularis TaxID=41276 RepID=UPI0038D4B891
MTLALSSVRGGPRPQRNSSLRRIKRLALMGLGFAVMGLGLLIAPLPGPGGIPVTAVGLVLVLRNSWWAKRQFIRLQYARPKWVYPFRRLLRKKPEIAPVFWQQALRAEKVVLTKRTTRQLIRARKRLRRIFRNLAS